ncbi:transposable element Tc1 transposase [Trichonephila clavipes]|nr:transposable element Tc1 transposase [Trichonephila clavipes]
MNICHRVTFQCLNRQSKMQYSAGLKARTPGNKPYIREVNRKRRLEFTMKYKNKPMDFWKKVIFSDVSKFEIVTPLSNRKIWRKYKTALEPKNVLPTLKHGDVNVKVWGCVAHNGAGNLAFIDNKMNALAYIDMLRHNLLDSAKKLSMENTFIFQQDNDPKHTAIVTKTWLLYHAPSQMNSLAASVKLTFSASMVNRLTDFCLKVRQEIGVSCIKVMNPPIDTRSSLFVSKSEYQ